MKYLMILIALITSGSLWADNELPACEGSAKTWNAFCSYAHYENNTFMGIYVGEWSNGRKHGQGTYTETKGDKYSGSWKRNKKSGQGTVTYPDGSKYISEWTNGKDKRKNAKWIDISDKVLPLCEGDAKTWIACSHSFPDGSNYFGQWKDGKKNGQGILKYADGTKYSGEWKDGKKHGQGRLNWRTTNKYPDGSGYIREQYSGTWKNGKRHGPGNFNGYKTRYYGNWKNDKKHGPGFFVDRQTKKVYEGTWKNDKKHGNGYSEYSDDSKYIGEWKEGNRNGIGIFIYEDGSQYVGDWKDNNKHQGKMFPVCNDIRDTWSDCSFSIDGDSYAGEWKNGKKHGQGTLTYKNNDIYSGEWKQGKWDGQGTYFRFEGNKKYIGRMQNGSLHGVVSFTSNDVVKENTIYFRGKYHGISNDAILKFNAMCKSEQEDSINKSEYAYRIAVRGLDKNLPLNVLREFSKNASQGLKTEISNADYIYKNCII